MHCHDVALSDYRPKKKVRISGYSKSYEFTNKIADFGKVPCTKHHFYFCQVVINYDYIMDSCIAIFSW